MSAYGSNPEDRHFERKLNEYLNQDNDKEYYDDAEEKIKMHGMECGFEFGYAWIARGNRWELTSGYFVSDKFYAEEFREFYSSKYWRRM